MVHVLLSDQKRDEWMRRITKMRGVKEVADRLKWNYADYNTVQQHKQME